MSKVLLIGYNPPEFEQDSKIEAAHYRTWQFLQPLLADGHSVCLCAATSNPDSTGLRSLKDQPRQPAYQPIDFQRAGWIGILQRMHDTFQPDCIVAINLAPCLYATRLRTDKPLWMDIYGDYLTIVQAAGYRARSNRGLGTSIQFLRQILKRGDIFSVCGTPQQHMLVGELAMMGRLNWRTFGYSFVQTILPGAILPTSRMPKRNGRMLLSQHGIDAEDIVVLWCGGYNTWTDVETLFSALEWAMTQESRLHYVSLGASTYQAPDNMYDRLQKAIDQSRHRTRFHLLGWRPWKELADYYWESDIGINIDALHYEAIYGTRTRLLEMMSAGLPIITSLSSELSYMLRERGAALVFEPGDWKEFGRQILTATRDPERRNTLRETALKLAQSELSFLATTRGLRDWVNNPRLAPDKTPVKFRERVRNWEYRARYLVRQLLWISAGLEK